MPVISPRRSSTSASSGLYGSTTSARTTGGDSSSTSSSTNRYSSYFDRAGSLSKAGSSSTSSSTYTPSSYSSYLNSYSASAYIPRASSYRSSSSASSYLSGGSSALDSYRSSSYLGNNDTTSYSRYGLRKPKTSTESFKKEKNDQISSVTRRNEGKKPPSGASSSTNADKRLSASCSSSSLARLVATSGLDIYEKYSPAHYKPVTELPRSRSALDETAVTSTEEQSNNKEHDRRRKEAIAVATVTLDRPRSRYSRLYSNGDEGGQDAVDNASSTLESRRKSSALKLANSTSSGDIPTATFTLRGSSSRASRTKTTQPDDNTDDKSLKNGSSNSSIRATLSTKSTKATKNDNIDDSNLRNGIRLAKSTESCNGLGDDLANTTNAKLKLSSSATILNSKENELGFERSASDSVNNGGAGTGAGGDVSTTATINLDVPTTSATASPKSKDKNFLKDECALAHAQVATPPSASPSHGKRNTNTANHVTTTRKLTKDSSAESRDAVGVKNIEEYRWQSQKNNNNNNSCINCNIYNNINSNSNSNNNNSDRISSLLQQQQQPKQVQQLQPQQESIRLNGSRLSAAHVMRRSTGGGSGSGGYGNTLDSITAAKAKSSSAPLSSTISAAATRTSVTTTAHKIDIQFNGVESSTVGHHKPTATTTKTLASSSLSSSSAPSSSYTTANKLNNGISSRLVKPLVHRSTATSTASRATGGDNQTYTNQVNNNSQHLNHNNINSNNNLKNNITNNNHNSHSVINNRMAASSSTVAVAAAARAKVTAKAAGTIEHEDIKYIDSDENPPISGSMGKFVPCLEPHIPPSLVTKPTAALTSTRTRPKSTIVCSSNHHVFEKINNYKYANGINSSSIAAETIYSSTSSAATKRTVNANANANTNTTTNSNSNTNTNSNSNSNTITNANANTNIDSNSIKASIEKFNSFSEQKRLPLANAVTLRAHTGATGSTSNLQYHRHSGSDFDSCNLRQLTSSGNGGGGGSLTRNPYRASSALTSQNVPLKAKVRFSDAVATTSTATTTYKTTSKQPQLINGERRILRESAGGSTSIENITPATVEDSIRSTSIKSTLPPASPTASRYWDRDRDRTTSISTLSSSTHNNIDGDKSSNDEKSEGLCGLRNIGNTCFMNSIIQCLSNTNELTKFLRNYNGMRSSTSTKDQQILQEFSKLIREMWTFNVHSVTPLDLKRAFSTKHRMYSDYNQQDAQEFLRFFLDSLHSALNSGVKGEQLKIDESLSDNKKADLTWEWYTRIENSLIRDLFVGQLKSTLRCTTCGNTSVTFDPFWDLSVPLPSSSRCKLDACLDLFIREEVLDGDEMPTCSKCKARRKCTKSFTIQRFPKYLVIHLKRFSETRWSKLTNIVEFPTGERELNMGPYGANANTNMYYSLYAISNHMGSTAGGHYVALCKHPNSRKWHEFNDNVVSESLSESHLVSSSAYILFYERA